MYYCECCGAVLCMFAYVITQPSARVLVKMEGPAQLLTFAPVMWGGQECSVKQVHYN